MNRLVLWFVRSPLGGLVHRLSHRDRDRACWVCALVWHNLERDPEFVAGLRRGMADIAAGRTVRYEVDADGTWWHDDGDECTGPDCLNPAHFEGDE